jgi:signal transduction histidine kinase
VSEVLRGTVALQEAERQRVAREFRNCQAGVSPKCHILRSIDCGAAIFRDRAAEF